MNVFYCSLVAVLVCSDLVLRGELLSSHPLPSIENDETVQFSSGGAFIARAAHLWNWQRHYNRGAIFRGTGSQSSCELTNSLSHTSQADAATG